MEKYPLLEESDKYLPSKEEFNQIKELCSRLKVFNNLFIRVDFYVSKKGIIFGEFTPHPEAGHDYSEKFISILDELMIKHNIHLTNFNF